MDSDKIITVVGVVGLGLGALWLVNNKDSVSKVGDSSGLSYVGDAGGNPDPKATQPLINFNFPEASFPNNSSSQPSYVEPSSAVTPSVSKKSSSSSGSGSKLPISNYTSYGTGASVDLSSKKSATSLDRYAVDTSTGATVDLFKQQSTMYIPTVSKSIEPYLKKQYQTSSAVKSVFK